MCNVFFNYHVECLVFSDFNSFLFDVINALSQSIKWLYLNNVLCLISEQMHVSIYNLFKYKYLQNYNNKNSIYLTQSFHFIMIVLPKFKKLYSDFLLLQEFHITGLTIIFIIKSFLCIFNRIFIFLYTSILCPHLTTIFRGTTWPCSKVHEHLNILLWFQSSFCIT